VVWNTLLFETYSYATVLLRFYSLFVGISLVLFVWVSHTFFVWIPFILVVGIPFILLVGFSFIYFLGTPFILLDAAKFSDSWNFDFAVADFCNPSLADPHRV